MVYASWRGLSNRPARGTLIACSGSGCCGGQVQGEACGGLVAKRGMRSRGVVIGDPCRHQFAGIVEVAEQGFVQKLVPHPAIEAFYEAVLHWLAGRDVVPFNLGLGAPLQNGVQGQLCPIIADDHPGLASPFDQRRQFPGDKAARDRCVGDRGQASPCEVVHHVQHPKPPPAGELVMHRTMRPPLVRGPWRGSRDQRALGTPQSGSGPSCRAPYGALCVCGRLTLPRGRADRCG